MKKLLSSFAIITAMYVATASPAQAATKIIFPKGSYCGSYSGDFRNSKVFSIYLMKGQVFEVKSASMEDTITVKDSRGKVSGKWSDDTTYQVTTRTKGMHYVTLKSPDRYQDVQFCAY